MIFKTKDEIMERNLEGKLLVYDIKNRQIYEFNESAKIIWLFLSEGFSREEIISNYALCFNIDRATAEYDVDRVVNELLQMQLIVKVGDKYA